MHAVNFSYKNAIVIPSQIFNLSVFKLDLNFLLTSGQKQIMSKRFWPDQWEEAPLQRVANQWVAWEAEGRFLSNQFNNYFLPSTSNEMSSISFNSAINEKPNQNTPQIILIHHFILVIKLHKLWALFYREMLAVFALREIPSPMKRYIGQVKTCRDIFNYVMTKCWRKIPHSANGRNRISCEIFWRNEVICFTYLFLC